MVGSSLAFLDATVVIVALPQISEDLNLGLTGQQWVYLAYSLTLASLYLVAGAVGDRWGRRDTFVYGAVGFAAASALAGFAPNEMVLIVARALQGVGGAFLTTNSLALLRSTFGSESGRAIGLWTSFTAVATIAGPPLGGALVEWVSWRWIFFINLPLAAVTVLLARAGRCQERAQVRIGRLDIPGAATAALGLGMITYALVEGADQGFGKVWWALAVGALSLAGFVVLELRAEEPLLPFRLFRRRNFAATNAETFLVYGAIGSVFVYLTLHLQFLGFTPFQAGLASRAYQRGDDRSGPAFRPARRSQRPSPLPRSRPGAHRSGSASLRVHEDEGGRLEPRRAGPGALLAGALGARSAAMLRNPSSSEVTRACKAGRSFFCSASCNRLNMLYVSYPPRPKAAAVSPPPTSVTTATVLASVERTCNAVPLVLNVACTPAVEVLMALRTSPMVCAVERSMSVSRVPLVMCMVPKCTPRPP